MLATGLWILKIIGMILLGIIGLILALILIVLLVPVRYRAEASWHGELKARASVSWLLHILSCRIIYDGEPDIVMRVFGFRVGRKGSDQDKPKAAPKPETPAPEKPAPEKPSGGTYAAPEGDLTRQEKKQLEKELWQELREEAKEEQEDWSEKPPSRFTLWHQKIKACWKRLKRTFSFQGICDKLEEIKQKKDRIRDFVTDEDNKKTFRLLWRQGRALLRHVLPRKLAGTVKFGFDDPYTTGQVLMYASPFCGLYEKHLKLIPVFEEPILDGEVRLRGRIRAGTALAIGIRLFMDKNFRRLLKKSRE